MQVLPTGLQAQPPTCEGNCDGAHSRWLTARWFVESPIGAHRALQKYPWPGWPAGVFPFSTNIDMEGKALAIYLFSIAI
jgi:hypothetical protein